MDEAVTTRRRIEASAAPILAVAAVLAVVLTGCGGGSSGPTEVAPEPEATTTLAESQQATIGLTGDPDWLTALDSFVFVKRANGLVTKIDTTTNEPVGEVQADTKSESSQFCEGIGTGGGSVWSCSKNDVVRIDPATLEVKESIPVGKIPDSGRLPFVGGNIWVLSGNGDQLVGIDAATGKPGPPLALPAPCTELGAGVDRVWAICPNANLVLGIDPEARTVEDEIVVASPTFAFGTGLDVWIGYADGLGRFDAESLDQTAIFSGLNPTDEGAVTVAGDHAWVRQQAGFLYRIDASTNTVVEQVVPDEPLSGGDVLVLEGAVWVSAYDDNLVLRLEP